MKRLREYIKTQIIKESENESKAYIYVWPGAAYIDHVEELETIERQPYIDKLKKLGLPDNFVGAMYDAWIVDKKLNHSAFYVPFRLNVDNKIKLSRKYADKYETFVDKKDDGTLITGVTSDHTWFKVNGKRIEIGDGSLRSISTSDQENGTCLVWNQIVDQAKEADNVTIDDIKEYVESLGSYVTKDWLESFKLQTQAIYKYLKSIGEDPFNYKAERYDTGDVGSKYKLFVKAYIDNYLTPEGFKNIQKDIYDPSDIILYRYDKTSGSTSVVEKLKAITTKAKNKNEETVDTARKAFVDLFTSHDVIGISLKKCKNGSEFEEMNSGEYQQAVDVTSAEIRRYGDGLECLCKGSFKFTNVTSPEDSVDDVDKEQFAYIAFRTFGSRIVYCDVRIGKSNKAVPIGKCPVSVWRPLWDIKQADNQESINAIIINALCKTDLKDGEYQVVKGDQLKKLAEIIESAAKYGPYCLPYVLIH